MLYEVAIVKTDSEGREELLVTPYATIGKDEETVRMKAILQTDVVPAEVDNIKVLVHPFV